MSQITIYLPDALADDVRRRAKAAGKSISAYVAERLEASESSGWSPEVLAAFGSIPDFPTGEELRAALPPYVPRNPFR